MNNNNHSIKKISTKLNYKVIIVIIGLAIVDLLYGLYFFDDSFFDIKDGFYMAGLVGCGVASVLVARKHNYSKIFWRAYLFLGIGLFSWFIADVGYYYDQFVLESEPWSFHFGVLVLMSYAFAILHLYINTRFFKPKWTRAIKTTLVLIPVIAVTTFTIIAYDAWGQYDELVFDLFYSNLFVVGASMTLAFAVVGASVFRYSVFRETWMLLASGIFLWVIADITYAYLETIEAFTHNHPINTLWMVSFMVIIYTLYKHHKAI